MDRESIIAGVIAAEGGDKLHEVPGDRGGLTKYGIAQRSHPDVRVASLTLDDAVKIYVDEYWSKIRGDDLLEHDPNVARAVFDAAVNIGVRSASKIAQRSCGAVADGFIGPKTIEAIRGTDPEVFVMRYTLRRISLYIDIVRSDPVQSKFFYGWSRRAIKIWEDATIEA